MILIADDDPDFAESCSMMLEAYGYDVSVVSNGSEAMAKILAQQPDLLISDCSMPVMGGLELSQKIKANAVCSELPILLMSGSMRCRVAPGKSYDAFLSKPFLAQDLLHEVRNLLKRGARAGHTGIALQGHR